MKLEQVKFAKYTKFPGGEMWEVIHNVQNRNQRHIKLELCEELRAIRITSERADRAWDVYVPMENVILFAPLSVVSEGPVPPKRKPGRPPKVSSVADGAN